MTELERDLRQLTPAQKRLVVIVLQALLIYAAVRSRYRSVRGWICSIPFRWVEWQL